MIGQAAVSGSVGDRIDGPVPHHLHLDAAAFLGARAHQGRRIRKAGIPMMPNVAGPQSTRRQIIYYSILLFPVGLAPVFLGFGGWLYASPPSSAASGCWPSASTSTATVRARRSARPRSACSVSRSSISSAVLGGLGRAGPWTVPRGARVTSVPGKSTPPRQLTPEERSASAGAPSPSPRCCSSSWPSLRVDHRQARTADPQSPAVTASTGSFSEESRTSS